MPDNCADGWFIVVVYTSHHNYNQDAGRIMLNNRYRQNVKFVSVYFSYHRLCYMISGKFELSREYPDYYKSVSQRLYTILDCATEASTEVRDLNVWTATTREILQTFDFLVSDTDDERTHSLYICDSFLRDFIGGYEV